MGEWGKAVEVASDAGRGQGRPRMALGCRAGGCCLLEGGGLADDNNWEMAGCRKGKAEGMNGMGGG
jgi:hypothetical protein